jgi:hypothetical protein
MFYNIVTHPFFLPCVIFFFSGSFGYIIVRMWLGPIARYGQLKYRIQKEIKPLAAENSDNKDTTDKATVLRQLAHDVTTLYHNLLPYWYRLLLVKKGEDPIKAVTVLQKLANTRNAAHAARQREEIMSLLKLKDK